METTVIKKSIAIDAGRDIVWNVLMDDKFIRIWYAEFHQGAYAKTDWQVGSKVLFLDESGSGLVGKVVENKPNEIVSVEYLGMLSDGVEDYDSDDAKALKGDHETYILSEIDGLSNLAIELDMSSDMFNSMSSAWDKALKKIRELAETK